MKKQNLFISGQETYDYATVLSNLAVLYDNMGLYEKTEPLSIKSLAITEKTVGKDHPEYAASLNNLAGLYYQMGLYEKAEPLFIESNTILLKALGKDNAIYASSLNNLASFYNQMGLYEKAVSVFDESKNIREKVLGKQHPAYAQSLSNLAGLYRNFGLYENAEVLYLESKDIREKSVGKEHPDYSLSLNNLGVLYEHMGQYEKAEQLYLGSLRINENVLGKDHPQYLGSLSNLAGLYRTMGMNEQAATLFTESAHTILRQVERYFPAMSEKEKEAFFGTGKIHIERFNSFALTAPLKQRSGALSDAYAIQLATKALLFNANSKVRQRIVNSKNDSLINNFLAWQRQRSLLANAYKLSAQEQKTKNIDIAALEEEINQQEKQMSLKAQSFVTLAEKKQYTWQDVQKQLNKGEAAVELVRFRKYGVYAIATDSSTARMQQYPLHGLTDTVYYAALIVTPKSKFPEPVLLKNGNALESKFLRNYKNSIRFKITDTVSYYSFWKPIADVLKNQKIKKIYLSPDGVYNSVNLNTLKDPNTGKYVNEELDIQLMTNTKDLITRRSDVSKGKPNDASLFGYPDYAGENTKSNDMQRRVAYPIDTTQRFFEGGRISQLPGTQKEIETVTGLLDANGIHTSEYVDKRASEEEVKRLSSPKILHIATHGFFLQDESVTGQTFAGFDAKKVMQNPLLRSGLLLANSQKTVNGFRDIDMEDGILTAYEAMNLNLDETELVVLSACETGLGEIRNGEGVYGLQRALQTAGAKSVLMSLWKVDDNATQELMTTFYKNWLKSGDKREAFNKAQASLRTKYKHPYYWGAFVLVGE